MSGNPSKLSTVRSVLETIASGDVSAMGLTGELVSLVERLPPSYGEGLSRPFVERGSAVTLSQSFLNVPVAPATQTESIQVREDVWVRGMTSTALLQWPSVAAAAAAGPLQQYGVNGRAWFETKFRLNDLQGFVYGPRTETFAPAVVVTGDGRYPSAMDWTLQKNQTIEFTIRSLVARLFAGRTVPTLRWVSVSVLCQPIEWKTGARRG